MKTTKTYGFISDKIKREDYVLGGVRSAPKKVAIPDGQWDDFLPEIEIQRRDGLETMNCTVYGTLNAIEMLEKARYGITSNYSDRYLGTLAGTTPTGNSPHKVAEVLRSVGVVPENVWPWDKKIKTWEQYYAPIPSAVLKTGMSWLDKNVFKHEWLFTERAKGARKIKSIKEALVYSPVCVSVFAWPNPDKNGIYKKSRGMRDNHWLIIFGYEKGKYWKAFDSYDKTIKHLDWRYDFNLAKRYHISYRMKGVNWLVDLVIRIFSLFK